MEDGGTGQPATTGSKLQGWPPGGRLLGEDRMMEGGGPAFCQRLPWHLFFPKPEARVVWLPRRGPATPPQVRDMQRWGC